VIGEGSGVVKWMIERFESRSTLEARSSIREVCQCLCAAGGCLSAVGYQCLTGTCNKRCVERLTMT
jgi:hypothetical protein